jgi:hypothetical protein
MDIVIWHLLLLFPQWCLVLPPCGGSIGHKDIQRQLCCFLEGIGKIYKTNIYFIMKLWHQVPPLDHLPKLILHFTNAFIKAMH